jgi:glutamine amidotransferase-like uncharacterized protein
MYFPSTSKDGKLVRNGKSVVLVIIIIVLTLGSKSGLTAEPQVDRKTTPGHIVTQVQTDLSGITVGIYYIGYYDVRVNNSFTALINMYEWMNATVRIFNTTDIINGSLWACEILSIPEGLGPILEYKLTDDGLQAIREWLAVGGSYIGVRGSAAMTVQYSYFENTWTEFNLALINGTSYEVEDLGHTTITNVSINRECTGPDLSDMPANMSVLFKTGRYILPNAGQELIYIANYTHSNLPAMVASYYGEGNVFISSPHFEYEENDDRDGTDYLDSYDDPDSEWPFMLEIAKWLVESSPTVQNLTKWPTLPLPVDVIIPMEILLVGGGFGVLAITVMIIFVKKR